MNEETDDLKSTAPRDDHRGVSRPERRQGGGTAESRKPRGFLSVAILLGVLILIAAISSPEPFHGSVETREFAAKELLVNGLLDPDTMEFETDTLTFRARMRVPDEKVSRVEIRFENDDQVSAFKDTIREYNLRHDGQPIAWQVKESRTLLWKVFVASLPWILFLFILYFLFIRQVRSPGGSGGILTFGKSRAKIASQENTGVRFSDVAGVQEAKEEVQEIVEFLRNPERFQRLGGRIPRGVMLVGPPGTGKTLLAKAISGEAGVPFFTICGSDFVEMFVGVGAARVRDLFKQARDSAPCIVFLDEVDAVGRRRGSGLGGGHDEREQTLNAILVEMDGFSSEEGIILIAATNRPDVLDPALLRPGRFDREINIDLPDIDGREQILKVHASKVKMDPSVDLQRLARGTPGFSGAELAALINEAAIIGAMKDQDVILQRDLEDARDKIRYGLQKKSRVMVHEDRLITAYHEAGHALVAHLLPEVEPLHKVTIIPRGMALGLTMQLPERDRYHMSRKQVLGTLKLLYAGRIAEEKFCGDVTSGAASDIERATDLVRRMVCEWGMSDAIGPIQYRDNEETLFLGREVTRNHDHSEATALRIDEEMRRIVDECYAETEQLLAQHVEEIERIAGALMERETLSGAEVSLIVKGESLPPLSELSSRPESGPVESEPATPAVDGGVEAGAAASAGPSTTQRTSDGVAVAETAVEGVESSPASEGNVGSSG